MSNRNVLGVGAALFVSALGAAAARAELVTYTIDVNQSSLTVFGSLAGTAATQQADGSLTTSFSGTIKANRTPGAIEFTGGSAMDATAQGPFQPGLGAAAGSAPADFGRRSDPSSSPDPFFEAIRNVVLDVSNDDGGLAVSGSNTFDSSALAFEFVSGVSEVRSGSATHENDFGSPVHLGNSNSGSASPSSVVESGGVETLTLRFNTGPVGYAVNGTALDSNVSFVGTIVATRAVPEPASGALGVAGLGGLLTLGRRARRRRA
jgi:hypothetical protein